MFECSKVCAPIGVAVLAFATALVGVSTGVNAQNDVIYACVGNNSGQTRIVGAAEACRSQEIRVQWNVAGPQGPQGPVGPAGPAGPAGTVSASADAITGVWSGRLFLAQKTDTLPYFLTTPNPAVGLPPNPSMDMFPATRVLNIPFSVACTGGTVCSLFSDGQYLLMSEARSGNHPTDSSFNRALMEIGSEAVTLELTGSGATVNSFFLLRIVATGIDDPQCPPTHFQAMVSIRADDPNGLNLTGSGGTAGPSCPPRHEFLSGGFRRQ